MQIRERKFQANEPVADDVEATANVYMQHYFICVDTCCGEYDVHYGEGTCVLKQRSHDLNGGM